ncbi:endonuclease III [candidate division WOR-1 bacterium RIFOXYA2_FULL_36_21]|uniref:Endonuclease III n=1 Tax=candidate division WOR-1 bacterium RIFOXYB2_FULL_36_35 TaxID=1802578 RepID=A0A1F4S222_UNCSA|nr:MAG: endonuclease III [candidate division WOR-1 bacterium RIFOXYA2_FULL_36_21]OGC14437.1 MAG: endonuclease III [candidate division WOR-1 bacterium RIFOXYB2_FULL_36_35]OGC19957.1 MAG: endonuclease III [candidate division WOR-1 bacterium RIFOXYA12_FULL_36_13]
MNTNKSFQIIKTLQRKYPNAGIALKYGAPIDLLVATILSAQCTDKRVNIVTKNLFKKYKTVKDYARARQSTFEKEIRSTGFYRNKAKNIINACKMILKNFNGRIPDTMNEILKLPGVARKTATVVLSHAYNKIYGITVDTHVIRLSQRLGLTKNKDAVKIEKDLMEIFPKRLWFILPHLFISHGRTICIARKPLCPQCPIKKLCPSYIIFMRKFYNPTVHNKR